MNLPSDIENIVLIAILRVLGLSLDRAASTLHVSKSTIMDVELWISQASPSDLEVVFTDSGIKSLVVRELPVLEEVDNNLQLKAVLVSREDIFRHYRPEIVVKGVAHLNIGSPRVDTITDGIAVARYAAVQVINESEIEAKDCWAWVEVLGRGISFPLHFRGTDVTAAETDAPRINISPEKPALLDVMVALPPPGRIPASRPKNSITSGDVAMYVTGYFAPPWNGQGCWLAQPLALYNPQPDLESFLLPGKYKLELKVGCANGPTIVAKYVIRSPMSWEDLDIKLE
jgi:hypothetical protein